MAKRETSGAEAPYHHGALREALLAATEALLDEAGLEKFTLRECARRAGVSHGAPAHHFGDARGLLTAFAAQSFEQLEARTRDYMARAEQRPYERLVANGLAYLDHALGNPHRFRLMFRSDRLDHTDPDLGRAATAVFHHFETCMREVLEAAGRPHADLGPCTAHAWSLVHGMATLMLDNGMFACRVGDHEAARTMFVDLMRRSRPLFEG
jgi:AcrR family transcriptional regulator